MKTIPRTFRRGNAILEAALVLPMLISLAFGTVEFSHFFYVKHCLQGAARQGVRAAIPANSTGNDITSAVSGAMTLYGLQNSGYICTTTSDSTNVTVAVQCTWGAVGIRPLGLIGADKLVKSAAVMRKE
jgi:Flp pilus assembly protein TadG